MRFIPIMVLLYTTHSHFDLINYEITRELLLEHILILCSYSGDRRGRIKVL